MLDLVAKKNTKHSFDSSFFGSKEVNENVLFNYEYLYTN
jgi:hypothetical protein